MTAVEWLMEQITYTNEFGCVCNSFIETADLSAYFEQAKEMEQEKAQQYAEFAIRCDRKGMKILNFEYWIKL